MFWPQWAKYNIANTNNNAERFGVNGLHITKQIQTIIQNVLASMGYI